jgi:hypothetical protein
MIRSLLKHSAVLLGLVAVALISISQAAQLKQPPPPKSQIPPDKAIQTSSSGIQPPVTPGSETQPPIEKTAPLDTFTGDILKLSQVTVPPNEKSYTTKVGSLVVVHIPHSGGERPVAVKVVAPKEFLKLGVISGNQDDDGNISLQGAYSWHLFKATLVGDFTVTVNYTPVSGGPNGKKIEQKPVERIYKIKVIK